MEFTAVLVYKKWPKIFVGKMQFLILIQDMVQNMVNVGQNAAETLCGRHNSKEEEHHDCG